MSDKDSLQGLLKTTSGGDGASYSLAFENGKIKVRFGPKAKTIFKVEKTERAITFHAEDELRFTLTDDEGKSLDMRAESKSVRTAIEILSFRA